MNIKQPKMIVVGTVVSSAKRGQGLLTSFVRFATLHVSTVVISSALMHIAVEVSWFGLFLGITYVVVIAPLITYVLLEVFVFRDNATNYSPMDFGGSQ